MAAEIAALLAATRAVGELLDAAKPMIERIGSGWRAKNEELQKQLAAQLEALEASIRAAGDLAHMGEEYARMHGEIRQLLWDCERAKSFLNENMDDCNDAQRDQNPGYAACWRIMDTIWDSIQKNGNPVQRVQTDRAQFYDVQDRTEIAQRLNDVAENRTAAGVAVRMRAALDAQRSLGEMIAELEKVSRTLDQTMYDKIFHSLQTLGR